MTKHLKPSLTFPFLRWTGMTAGCLALAAALPALAQRPAGATHGASGATGCAAVSNAADAAALVEQLVARYGLLVPFDRNLDGQIDESERAALASAIKQGTVRPDAAPARPAFAPNPPSDTVATRVVARYHRLAAYDTNRDGHLDAAERERLNADVRSGKAMPCGRPG